MTNSTSWAYGEQRCSFPGKHSHPWGIPANINSPPFTKEDVASAWLTSAHLARKGNSVHQSFNAVLHASQLGHAPATIEHARLLWKEGNHRKAIQSLQGA